MYSVEDIREERAQIIDLLSSINELTTHAHFNENYTKMLILSCASRHEKMILDMLKNFIQGTSSDERVCFFAENKGMKRQYHTFVNWDSHNINNFLGLFGEEFKNIVCAEIRGDTELNRGMKEFIWIGRVRNLIIHNDYLTYTMDDSFDDILNKNEQAMHFLDYLQDKFSPVPNTDENGV